MLNPRSEPIDVFSTMSGENPQNMNWNKTKMVAKSYLLFSLLPLFLSVLCFFPSPPKFCNTRIPNKSILCYLRKWCYIKPPCNRPSHPQCIWQYTLNSVQHNTVYLVVNQPPYCRGNTMYPWYFGALNAYLKQLTKVACSRPQYHLWSNWFWQFGLVRKNSSHIHNNVMHNGMLSNPRIIETFA